MYLLDPGNCRIYMSYGSYGQNLVHGKATSLSRVDPYLFCSGAPWTNLPQGIVLGGVSSGLAVMTTLRSSQCYLLWSYLCNFVRYS